MVFGIWKAGAPLPRVTAGGAWPQSIKGVGGRGQGVGRGSEGAFVRSGSAQPPTRRLWPLSVP